MAESVGTISQQNMLLCEVHQCSSGPSYNPCELYPRDALSHWTKKILTGTC